MTWPCYRTLGVYLVILLLELNSHGCSAYHRYYCPKESSGMNGPSNKTNYSASCTCYRVLHALDPTENWQPSVTLCMSQGSIPNCKFPQSLKSLVCFFGGRILIKWIRCKNLFFPVKKASWHLNRSLAPKTFRTMSVFFHQWTQGRYTHQVEWIHSGAAYP